MSRSTDDNYERTRTLTVEGETGPVMIGSGDGIPTSVSAGRRDLHATVDADGMDVVSRALMLYLANRTIMERSSPAVFGEALVQFARAYVQAQVAKGGGA